MNSCLCKDCPIVNVGRLVGRMAGQLVIWSVGWLVGRSVGRLVGRLFVSHPLPHDIWGVTPVEQIRQPPWGARLRGVFSQSSVISNLVLVSGLWTVLKSGLRIWGFLHSTSLELPFTISPSLAYLPSLDHVVSGPDPALR